MVANESEALRWVTAHARELGMQTSLGHVSDIMWLRLSACQVMNDL